MATIQIEAQISTEQLLHAVAQLPPEEFASFVARLLELQARGRERQPPDEDGSHADERDQELARLAAGVRSSGRRVLGLNRGGMQASDDFDAPLLDEF